MSLLLLMLCLEAGACTLDGHLQRSPLQFPLGDGFPDRLLQHGGILLCAVVVCAFVLWHGLL